MFSQALKILILGTLVLSFTSVSFAGEEKKEEKKAEGGKEEKKDEKKEGEAGKEEKKEEKKEDDWAAVQAKVQALEAKVKAGQEEINHMIEEKQHTKDPRQVAEIIKNMTNAHKELEKNVEEYNQQKSLLKYRYPEKGAKENREYERIEVKSLKEMEDQMSLSTSVNKTLKKVRSQYETPAEVQARQEQEAHRKEKQKSDTHLTEPVILSK